MIRSFWYTLLHRLLSGTVFHADQVYLSLSSLLFVLRFSSSLYFWIMETCFRIGPRLSLGCPWVTPNRLCRLIIHGVLVFCFQIFEAGLILRGFFIESHYCYQANYVWFFVRWPIRWCLFCELFSECSDLCDLKGFHWNWASNRPG